MENQHKIEKFWDFGKLNKKRALIAILAALLVGEGCGLFLLPESEEHTPTKFIEVPGDPAIKLPLKD